MILIGIGGLWLVAILWVLLYIYFLRRTDRFMENWEREIKEKAEKSTLKSIQSLEEVAKGVETLPESIRSLEEAAEAIKASRKAMEKFAFERGYIPEPPPEEFTPSPPALRSQNLDMPSILYRIDERLIHAQVVVGWGNSLRLDKIVLVNDKVAKNPWEREFYLACVPPEIKTTILSVDEAVNQISKEGFKKEKTILLVDSPFDILRMVEKGVQIDWVNIGGIHSKQGRKKILPYLYLSCEEISVFKKLFLLGIRCECRDVPLAEKKDLSILLEKLNL